ncbi:helix-turn-helix transcriptional regulator [Tsukamurella asaccharolytica]|uniref:Helix-turn-helix transcriptional regulator n=1 Tax=Tsukamurella asaccharolytica TaxID=2592067 RepID=A0A5C5RCK9_9ACTN|nr:helix-turn-helix domain-containing protein [Tsukamurella asaccharolytica]TWS20817.1 helix-turn-helix transcriptional regulator [Tsukamurella asaccharolytica]
MPTTPSVARLGEAVKNRRGELGMSQADVMKAGGPSDTTQSKIELGVALKVGAQTLAKYDRALRWKSGRARAVLMGDAVVAEDAVDQRGEQAKPRRPRDGAEVDAVAPIPPRRPQFGAWSLGPDLMVQLDLAADEVEFMANTSSGYTEEDDITAVIDDLENLVYAVDELLPILRAVTEVGVGGTTHLAIEKAKEQARRKSARAAKMQADVESALERKGKQDAFGRPVPPEGLEYHTLPPSTPGIPVEQQGESLAETDRQPQDLTANAHPDGPDRWPSGEPVYDEHWSQWKAWQSAGAPVGAWEAFRASNEQQAYDLAQRFIDRPTDAERLHRAQDDDAEAPDSEGPEAGA